MRETEVYIRSQLHKHAPNPPTPEPTLCHIMFLAYRGFPTERARRLPRRLHEPQKSHSKGEVREIMRGEEEGTSAYPSVLEPKLGQSLLLLLRPSGTAAMTASTVFMCVSVFSECKSICTRVSLLYSTMKGKGTSPLATSSQTVPNHLPLLTHPPIP